MKFLLLLIFIFQFFSIISTKQIIIIKKCSSPIDYSYAVSKINEINYFIKFNYQHEVFYNEYLYPDNGKCVTSYKIQNNITKKFNSPPVSFRHCDIFTDSPWKHILSVKLFLDSNNEELLYTNTNMNGQECIIDIALIDRNYVTVNEIKLSYSRTDYNNGTSLFILMSSNIKMTNTAYQTSPIYYFYFKQINNRCYFTVITNIEVCPRFCNIGCEFFLKYCTTSEIIDDIIMKYIQEEKYPLESHFNSTIIDETKDHYNIYKMDFSKFKFPHNKYITEFCPKVLIQKYSPIDYFVIFHNKNDTEKSIIIKDNRDILDYKKYCQNYSVTSFIINHSMKKKNEINFSHYFLKYKEEEEEEPNDLMNNTITYDSLRGRLEFEKNGNIYTKLNLYNMKDIIVFIRDGIYYYQVLTFQFTYGSLFFPYEDKLKGNITFDIYPFYCDNKNYNNRTCWTNYSLNGIKNEIQMALLDLHEHVDERIIGNGFIVDIFDKNSINILTYSDLQFPLRYCNDVYKSIDNNIQDIIFVKFEVNNDVYYDIYNSDSYNHTKLNVDYCIYHKISDLNYQMNDKDVFKLNLNDLISPKLTDNNIYDNFILTFNSNFKGIIKEEIFQNNNINEINLNFNFENEFKYYTQSRKYFYYPISGYYSFFFLFEIFHINNLSYNMKGKITISVFPEYCNKKLSIISEKKCFTNYKLDDIKNYILNNKNNYNIHFNEYIINPLYNLTSIELHELANHTCNSILKQLYGNNNYFVLIINEDKKGETKELYNKEVVPFEKINENLCNKVYDIKIDKVINYNLLINIYDIIKDILPKVYESNFFEIKIYTEKEYLQKYSRRLNSIQENNLVIEYIPTKFRYYDTKYYFEIEKNNVFLNIKGEINFKVFPYYCEDYNVNRNCSSKKSLEEIINYINVEDIENIEEHINEIIYNDDYVFQIEKMNSNLLSNKFDFELCEKEIRETYFLNENETLYLETIENQKTNVLSFHIFNSKGFEYNSSFCSSISLNIKYTLDLIHASNYQKLINLGYDIYNISSPFYNDLCISYSFNGNDVILKDRKEKIFPGNMCYKNCDYKLFDNEIKCECKMKLNNQIIELNSYKLNFQFDNKTYFVNYKFVKCSNLVFNKNIIKIFGFWFMLLIIFIQIFIIFHYFYNSENYLYNLIEVLDYQIPKNTIIKINEQYIDNNLKDNENGESSAREIVPYKKENNSIEYEIRNHTLNSLVSNIDYFRYSDSLNKDTRNYFSMLISLIKEKSFFIRSIYKYSLFELQSINFFMFLLNISFILSFNILFFSENYISEKFINNKISSFSNIKKMFFSSLFNMIIIKIILLFNNYSTILNKIIYEFHGNNNFKFIALKYLDIQKFKIRTFLFINLIISIGLLYFVSAFCALYQKTQFYLFLGTIFSIFFSYGIFLFLGIIISILRYISLRKKYEYIYYFSSFLRQVI